MAVEFDVVIVGSGPAGIACALSIKQQNPETNMVILEKGRRLTRRPCPVDRGRRCTGCGGICNVISGFGGSIHYGDGVKLSLLPSGRRLIDLFGDESQELCDRAYKIFMPDGTSIHDGKDSPRTTGRASREILSDYGIIPREYPVEVIGETQLRAILHRLEQDVQSAATIFYQCTLTNIETNGNHLAVSYLSADSGLRSTLSVINAKAVVLATGRAGISTTQNTLANLGVEMTPPSYSKGVRVEMAQKYLQNIGSEYPDLKVSSKPGSQKTKTFCFCGGVNGGRIKFTHYQSQFEEEIITLDGHETLERVANEKELAANFGLLCQQAPLEAAAAESDKFRVEIMEPYLKLSGGRPVVQSLADFRARRIPVGSWHDLAKRLIFNPSVADLKLAPVHQLFSKDEHDSIVQTFDRVMQPIMSIEGENYSRDMLDDSVIIIAPEIEFLWNKVAIDHYCETSARGLYVIGDAAGFAQGVIQAVMMGVRAGDRIVRDRR